MSQITVSAGGNLQGALDSAIAGDTVLLEAGATFQGQFTLPAKSGVVTLTSTKPLPDRRITPADAPLLPTIVSSAAAMAVNGYGTANWKFDGLRFLPNPGGAGEVIGLQDALNITLDRLLLVVPEGQQQKRWVLGNGRQITFRRSCGRGLWREGQDSQYFAAWDGAGPYTLEDDDLDGASENVLFGGADSTKPENIPADILIQRCLFTKPLAWKGQARVVKNLLELKAAKRARILNNEFRHLWPDAQAGRAILFTPRNQDGAAPWTVVEDVLVEGNVIRDVPTAFSITGYDDIHPSQQTRRIVIRNNDAEVTGSIAVLLMNEIGRLELYRNRLAVPTDAAVLSLSQEGSIALQTGFRQPQFAVDALTWAENQTTGYIHSPSAIGEAALKAYTRSYSLSVEPEPPDPLPTPVDPLNALVEELAAVKAESAATKARLEKLLVYLGAAPTATRIAQVVAYLRGAVK